MNADKRRGRRAVFLDRDGTITREPRQPKWAGEPDKLRLLPGAAAAIRRLNEAGLAVIVITNQSGVARGLFGESDVMRVHGELVRRLAKSGASIDGIYYCPHHPEAALAKYRRRCRCRKPSAGLLKRAARELGLNLGKSFVIGDNTRDLEAGQRAGCRAVLVLTGLGKTMLKAAKGIADHTAPNLAAAVDWILCTLRNLRSK